MLVFDLDDTLYLERDFALSGFRHLDGYVGRTLGLEGFGAVCSELFEDGQRGRIFNQAFERLGRTPDPETIADLVTTYRLHPPRIALCPDADRLLARCPRPIGLITDGPAQMQRNKIAALGLHARIDFLRPTGEWPPGYGKPHPRAFAEMEGHAPDTQMIYVADNPAKDFVTPNARGWTTFQIVRDDAIHDPVPPRPDHAAHHVIKTLADLANLV